MPKRKARKHKVGSSWTAMRTVGKRRRKVKVTKVGKSRYKVRVMGHKAAGRRRDRKLYNKSQPWEKAYRKRKRRRRRR